ncbi:MAG TPA: hypothetical protein VJ742_13175 [Nitrososphaera sp.]|nr:hypothetical protein [Nitrososphaera sp.]
MAGEMGAMGTPAQSGTSWLKYGVYHQPGQYANRTVAEVRQEYTPLWNIPGNATAYKGKQQLPEDYVIQAGDTIEFHRRMGEKG